MEIECILANSGIWSLLGVIVGLFLGVFIIIISQKDKFANPDNSEVKKNA